MKINIQAEGTPEILVEPAVKNAVPTSVNRLPAALFGVFLVCIIGLASYVHHETLLGSTTPTISQVVIHSAGVLPNTMSVSKNQTITIKNNLEKRSLLHLGSLCTNKSECQYIIEPLSEMSITTPEKSGVYTLYITNKAEHALTMEVQ